MSVWDRYEGVTLDGQISIFDLQKVQELDKKYDIPRDYQKEEGWTDDWHYTEIETPKESRIYYVICNTPQGHYNYTYMAWAYEHWWRFDSYQKKWNRCSAVRYENHIPFAWVDIPDLYFRTDSCLEERFEAYIEPKLNEYFEDQDRRRMERRKELGEHDKRRCNRLYARQNKTD